MAMDNFQVDVTQITAIQYHELGQRYVEPSGFGSDRDTDSTGSKHNRGRRVWIYVQMTGAAAAVGSVLTRAAASQTYAVRKTTQASPQHPIQVVGVAQWAITQNYYGWILREGVGEVLADTGGLTVDTGQIVGNAVDGTADDAAAITGAAFGVSLENAAATALATSHINCQG